jgi:hypothetical protein
MDETEWTKCLQWLGLMVTYHANILKLLERAAHWANERDENQMNQYLAAMTSLQKASGVVIEHSNPTHH